MDMTLFEAKVSENGLKYKYIAEKLGLSEQGLTQKRKGNIPFKAYEIKTLKELLNLSDQELNRIFL